MNSRLICTQHIDSSKNYRHLACGGNTHQQTPDTLIPTVIHCKLHIYIYIYIYMHIHIYVVRVRRLIPYLNIVRAIERPVLISSGPRKRKPINTNEISLQIIHLKFRSNLKGWHKSGSTLAMLMTCWLTASINYLHQCRFIISEVL